MESSHVKPPDAAAAQAASPGARRDQLAELLRRGDGAQLNVDPLLRLMRCEAESANCVTAAIEGCAALSAKLLSVINSAAFGLPRSIDSVRRAVLQLGPARARATALAFAMRLIQDQWQLPPTMATHLWINSLRKASAARLACETMDPARAEDAFCVALIQDVGLPALIRADTRFYETRIGDAEGGTWCAQESAHFGLDHAEAGALLLAAWGAPRPTCDAVRAHHQPPLREQGEALATRMSGFLAALVPHFGETPSGYEREWLTALHGQLLVAHYASPDAFLDAAAAAAKQVHGDTHPPAVDASIVARLAQVVCDDTAALVRQLGELEDALGRARQQTHALRFAACTDPLTGLLNRRGFFDLGARRLALAAAQRKAALVLAIDIDDFKQVNDTHGHETGDRLLSALAHLLRDHVGREDLIGRLGGDEFVILTIGADEARARAIADRLNDRCNGVTFDLERRRSVTLRFSLGALFCEALPGGVTLDRLLADADDAMYRRKRDGNARYVFVHYPADADRQPRPAA